MTQPSIIIIADDLTGAADAAATAPDVETLEPLSPLATDLEPVEADVLEGEVAHQEIGDLGVVAVEVGAVQKLAVDEQHRATDREVVV